MDNLNRTLAKITAKLNIPQTDYIGQTLTQSDELTLLFGGRTYTDRQLQHSRHDIDAAMRTGKLCQKCQGFSDCMNLRQGWQVFFDESASDMYQEPMFRWSECEYSKLEQLKQQEQILIAPRFQQRSFDTFQVTPENSDSFQKCADYADTLPDKGLLLIGDTGTGKTHLAASILRVAIQKQIPSAFILVPTLMDELRPNFKGVKVNAENAKTKRLIVLDDMGAEYIRQVDGEVSWVESELYKVVNHRYEHMLPTIITSNCTVAELERRIGKRIVDRLLEMCDPVVLEGKSWRRRR